MPCTRGKGYDYDSRFDIGILANKNGVPVSLRLAQPDRRKTQPYAVSAQPDSKRIGVSQRLGGCGELSFL